MKKLALLLSMALLAACGGGGSSGTQSNSGYQAGGPTGTLAVTIKETAKTAPEVTTAQKTMRRIVVTNPLIKNSDGKVVQFFFADYDVATLPAPVITIPNIPVATGYTAEVIDFVQETTSYSSYSSTIRRFVGYTTNHTPFYRYTTFIRPGTSSTAKPFRIIKYHGVAFDMPASGSAGVTLIPAPITVNLALEKTFRGGMPSNANISYNNLSTLYTIKVVPPALSPVNTSTWFLKGGYVNSATTLATKSPTTIYGATSADLVGPAAYDPSNAFYTAYYSLGEFGAKEAFIKSGESSFDFLLTSAVLPSTLHTRTNSF